MWKRRFYPLMDAAGEGGDPGGGAGGDGGAAGAGAGAGEGGAAAGGDPASLLAGGAAGAPTTDFIPEKYRVNKEDGALDLEASSRKLAEAYSAAEKRIGGGDIPPKTADEYTVTVPDALKEAFDPATDEGFKAFAGEMHALGLTQKQLDGVMKHYFDLAPKLVAGASMLDATSAKTQLKQVWASQGGFDHQVRNAYQGAAVLAQKAGLSIDDIMAPTGLGNNVQFLRLMAAIAPEFAEDKSHGGTSMGGATTEDKVNEMMMSDAYKNPKHPDHEKVSATVRSFFERKYGTAAAA